MSIIPNSHSFSRGIFSIRAFLLTIFSNDKLFILLSRRRFFFFAGSGSTRFSHLMTSSLVSERQLFIYCVWLGNVVTGLTAKGLAHIPGHSSDWKFLCRRIWFRNPLIYWSVVASNRWKSHTYGERMCISGFGRFLSFIVVVQSPSENSFVNRESQDRIEVGDLLSVGHTVCRMLLANVNRETINCGHVSSAEQTD